jgi:hypothetical protein
VSRTVKTIDAFLPMTEDGVLRLALLLASND